MTEEQESRSRAIAHSLLGSSAEAAEAVREARTEADAGVDGDTDVDIGVARACLRRLRAREARRRDPWDPWAGDEPGEFAALDALTPAERVAFVLHDMFAVPVDRIAPVVERAPAATRQLVSRAATRVRDTEELPEQDLTRQREVVAAVLTAARAGDRHALRALFDPDVLLRADAEAVRAGATPAHGAGPVADHLAERARTSRPALVDGAAGLAGLAEAEEGTVRSVVSFTVIDGRVTAVDVLMDPAHLDRLAVELLDG
ncbi:RNA polymerase subunit sigma-70 [Streptomyces sp. NPDC090127]|uniref:RNA polymerase subunit sigma-70 n=1 Tax=Streptomyces sp. NPDC090127 TaxID=3365953 RepID=UPI00382E5BA5